MAKIINKQILQAPHVWAFTTYFAEGFPYTLIRIVSSVYFRHMKVSLEAIGLTSLFGLPWVLKFLWGPQIDEFGTKRRWLLNTQGLLLFLFLLVALLTPFPGMIRAVAVLLFAGAIIAATHDMAIDGYYMEALDTEGQAKYVGYRVMAYRIAMMTGTGIVVTVGAVSSWRLAYFTAAAMLGVLFLYHLSLLPRVESLRKPIHLCLSPLLNPKRFGMILLIGLFFFAVHWSMSLGWYEILKTRVHVLARIRISGWIGIGLLILLILTALFRNRIKQSLFRDPEAFYSRAFLAYMDREKMGVALAFIILMRTGESMLASMVSPFFVDLGIMVHYGWISGGVGLPFSILGAMLGGWFIARYGLKKTIWPFLLAQNLTNVMYMILALGLHAYVTMNTGATVPTPIGAFNLFLVASVHAFDQFAGGLGTAVLITFLMRTCLPQFKAAHYAIGTGLMNISGVLSGVISGFLAEWLGYGWFFGVSFLASIPGMALIFFTPFLEEQHSEKEAPEN
jgi:MFS transporter, PAT family, beta-lactamase induction signal transducer AmpG